MSGAGRKGDPPPAPEPLAGSAADCHCHLEMIGAGTRESIDAAVAVGITRLIDVGVSVAASERCAANAAEHPEVWAAVAVHPTEVGGLVDADYHRLAELAAQPRVVAIGETGLDYHWERTSPQEQREHFRRHLDLARAAGKPVMIHDRQAHEDILEILRRDGAPAAGVVFHSFSGDAQMARHCVERGWYLSISGVVTFRNAPALRAAVQAAPLDALLAETDAPFLTPHPYRGRPNSPYLTPWTIRAMAVEKGVAESVMCATLERNAQRLFEW
ncbi:MAG: TatD family hydrolase [Frankiaceae bacterium]|nr:TatD family hydrolase [Frankiaceae bacterium]